VSAIVELKSARFSVRSDIIRSFRARLGRSCPKTRSRSGRPSAQPGRQSGQAEIREAYSRTAGAVIDRPDNVCIVGWRIPFGSCRPGCKTLICRVAGPAIADAGSCPMILCFRRHFQCVFRNQDFLHRCRCRDSGTEVQAGDAFEQNVRSDRLLLLGSISFRVRRGRIWLVVGVEK